MTVLPTLVVSPAPFDSPEAATLIAELQAEYVTIYGGPDETPVEPGEFAAPTGTFLVARRGADLAGCAGLRRREATTAEVPTAEVPTAEVPTAELKRMYVRRALRGQGLGRLLLAAVEVQARELEYRRVVLESGDRQPVALALYRSAGYEPIEPYGIYADSESARYLSRTIA